MPHDSMPDKPRAVAAWARVRRRTRDLFDALADLDEAGGVGTVIEARGWRPHHFRRAAGSMRLVRGLLKRGMDRIRVSRQRGW